jgi:dCMP deaminase
LTCYENHNTGLDRLRQLKWDLRYLELAALVRTWSKDPSTQHATVIVSPDNHVLGMGYNGFGRGDPSEERQFTNRRDEKLDRVVHGEMNAIMAALAARGGWLHGCTAYVQSGVGCSRCIVHALQAGVTRFVFPKASEDYLERWGDHAHRSLDYIDQDRIPRTWSVINTQTGAVLSVGPCSKERRIL